MRASPQLAKATSSPEVTVPISQSNVRSPAPLAPPRLPAGFFCAWRRPLTYPEMKALLLQNKHRHALEGVGSVRFMMLESQLARARQERKEAERKLHEYICSENDELNRLKAENRRLMSEVAVLRKAILSA